MGQLSQAVSVRFTDDASVFGITLHPMGFSRLIARGGHELQDSVVPLEHLNPGLHDALVGFACGAEPRCLGRFAAHVDSCLLRSLLMPPAFPVWLAPAVRRMQRSAGLLPVRAYSGSVGLSERQLENAFREHVGCPPKAFLRAVRLSRFLDVCTGEDQPDLTTVAMELGFFDQAHMSHEIRRMTGYQPRQYFSRLSEVLGKAKLLRSRHAGPTGPEA